MAYSGNPTIPADADDVHVFAIKKNAAGVFEAFIGYTFEDGSFHYKQVRVEDAVIRRIKQNTFK